MGVATQGRGRWRVSQSMAGKESMAGKNGTVGIAAGLARAAGILLIAVPLLPLRAMFGELGGASLLVPPTEWILGLSISGVLAWILVPLIEAVRSPLSRFRA